VLSVVDQSCLDGHDSCHQTDHGQQKRTTTNSVDQEPGNERGQEEPSVQESRHESREVRSEAQTLLEQGTRVVDECVDTSKLLEGLDTASDEESASALDAVVLEKVAPGTGTDRLLNGHSANNVAVDALDFLVAHLVLVQTSQDIQSFFVAVSGSKPARRLWDDQDDEDHGDQEDALEDGGYTPDEASAHAVFQSREGIIYPIYHADLMRNMVRTKYSETRDSTYTKVQSRQLGANISATSCLWRKFGLHDWYGRVDEAHADSTDNSCYDHVGDMVSSSLQNCANDHDDNTDENRLASTQRFADETGNESSNETTDFVDGYNQSNHIGSTV